MNNELQARRCGRSGTAVEPAPDESKRDGRCRRQGLVPSVAREVMTPFWIEAVVNPGGQSTSTARLQCSPSFWG